MNLLNDGLVPGSDGVGADAAIGWRKVNGQSGAGLFVSTALSYESFDESGGYFVSIGAGSGGRVTDRLYVRLMRLLSGAGSAEVVAVERVTVDDGVGLHPRYGVDGGVRVGWRDVRRRWGVVVRHGAIVGRRRVTDDRWCRVAGVACVAGVHRVAWDHLMHQFTVGQHPCDDAAGVALRRFHVVPVAGAVRHHQIALLVTNSIAINNSFQVNQTYPTLIVNSWL